MPESHRDASRITGPDACRAVLFVGEDNPLSTHGAYALYHEPPGCAGYRLQRVVTGLPARTYLAIWRTNLCVGGWDNGMAEGRAMTLLAPSAPWLTIVGLGVKVAKAFGAALGRKIAPFDTVFVHGGATLLSLPHPSGRNAASWGPAGVARARAELQRLAPLVPWGSLDEQRVAG